MAMSHALWRQWGRALRLVLLCCVLVVILGSYYRLSTSRNGQVHESKPTNAGRQEASDADSLTLGRGPNSAREGFLGSDNGGGSRSEEGPILRNGFHGSTAVGFTGNTHQLYPPAQSHHDSGVNPRPATPTAQRDTVYNSSARRAPTARPSSSNDRTGFFPRWKFDPGGNDTIVHIHIQKTSGTVFQQHLVTLRWNGHALCSLPPTQKTKNERAICTRPSSGGENPKREDPWLVSKKVVGWLCGVHATYTEFKTCLRNPRLRAKDLGADVDPRRNFLFVTFLRHPVLRYLSEYFHVQRGAKWSQRHRCGGEFVRDSEMPPCYPGFYEGEAWTGVTLELFLACDSNWANNRQTLQLADLEAVGCYGQRSVSREDWERRVLQSAKENLARFAYFGLAEFEEESGLLFEETFSLEFGEKMQQRSYSEIHSAPILQRVWKSKALYDQVLSVNRLDWALYEYALDLFAMRLGVLGVKINRTKVNDIISTLSPENLVEINMFTKLNYTLPKLA